jgi:hypothetical protein
VIMPTLQNVCIDQFAAINSVISADDAEKR